MLDLHPLLRRERDSNPRRCYPQRFSRPPQSTTLPSLLLIDTLPCFSKAMQRYGLFSDCPNIFATFFKNIFRCVCNRLGCSVLYILLWNILANSNAGNISLDVRYPFTWQLLHLSRVHSCWYKRKRCAVGGAPLIEIMWFISYLLIRTFTPLMM